MDTTISVKTFEEKDARYVYECSICDRKWYSTKLYYAEGADLCTSCDPMWNVGHDSEEEYEDDGERTNEYADKLIEPNMAINDLGIRIACENEDIDPDG